MIDIKIVFYMHSSLVSPVSLDGGLQKYLSQINVFPLLAPEEEARLANRWIANKDISAAHTLVTSHLRLVAKIAMGFKGYGLPIMEMISEGNIGLMHAVKKFDPDKGCRFSTYAMWWIKAEIQEYILRSWSLVKIATTSAQRKLFFSLRKIQRIVREALAKDQISEANETKAVASAADVSEKEVLNMDSRLLQTDFSLNDLAGGPESNNEWQDLLEEPQDNQEVLYFKKRHDEYRRKLLFGAINTLNDRERKIIMCRRLQEQPDTLEKLSKKYRVSPERIRQIEAKTLQKIKKYFEANAS
ncbi:RNA polymerase sigma factor RpoH [Rickettsiales bacterium]|nr:RNA polymerase sigma factor RpoH [Rickettsiales bacterium]